MKTVLIRDLAIHIYEGLKRLARIHHRSMQGELHVILEWPIKI